MSSRCVAVYGAAGHTGRFVAGELARRGLQPVLIGRDAPAAGGGVGPWRTASCDEPGELDLALAGADAVINCAGPFADTAPSIVEAALRCGIHYLDVAAEQRVVRQTLATYDTGARECGVVVMPAVAFYGGLADLLATMVTHGAGRVESIRIGVALDYWHPTPGTRRTGARNTARRLVVADGRLAPAPVAASPGEWLFPEPFGRQPVATVPLSEVITINRHLPARSVSSFMTLAPLEDLGNPATPPPVAADDTGRSSQKFLMDVIAATECGTRRACASGRDIYAVTAPMVVEACQRILLRPPATGGTFVAGELFDASDFLAALAPEVNVRGVDPDSSQFRIAASVG